MEGTHLTKLDVLRSRLRFKSPPPSPIELPGIHLPHLPRSASGGGGGLARRVTTHLSAIIRPEKPLGAEPTWASSFSATVKSSWWNTLLLLVPVSWVLHFVCQEPSIKKKIVVFVLSYFAMIPLGQLLGFATEEIAIRIGQTVGGLLCATLDNAVEFIIAIIALTKCELAIVQSALAFSLLRNLLFVLGMCFFSGGIRWSEQSFLAPAAQLNRPLLTLSVVAVLLPAAYYAVTPAKSAEGANLRQEGIDILKMSRGVSIFLLFLYAGYLVFILWSHAHLYEDVAAPKSTKHPINRRKWSIMSTTGPPRSSTGPGDHDMVTIGTRAGDDDDEDPKGVDQPGDRVNGTILQSPVLHDDAEEEEEVEVPTLNIGSAIVLLVVVTALVGFTAEFLVDSVNGITEGTGISRECTGLILVPIGGKIAEHIRFPVKDKLTLSMTITIGSCVQLALFILPLLNVIAWGTGKPLSLFFDPLESVTLFLAVVTVHNTMVDGKSNWYQGMILMSLYGIVGIVFWFYKPDTHLQEALGLVCPGVPL